MSVISKKLYMEMVMILPLLGKKKKSNSTFMLYFYGESLEHSSGLS